MSKFEKQLRQGHVVLARIKYNGNGKAVVVIGSFDGHALVRYAYGSRSFKVAYSALREF
jgi:hypothetical protein